MPKFEGKQGDDPITHITSYHLWCVSNSMVYYSICLRIFPRTLTGNVAKYYIELPWTSVNTFGLLEMETIRYFQLPIIYETIMELLTTLCQDTCTHISDHIHEWRCKQRLVNAPIPDYLLAY